MAKLRLEKLQELMREEISKLVLFELKDPRLGFITITKAEITDDYLFAKVFYTVLGDDKQKVLSRAGLNQSRKYLQGEVTRRMRLRLAPELSFEYDTSIDRQLKMEQLIKEARATDINPPTEAPPAIENEDEEKDEPDEPDKPNS